MKYTIHSVQASDNVIIVGPIAYLSNKTVSRQTQGKLAIWLSRQPWFQALAEQRGFALDPKSHLGGWFALEMLLAIRDEWRTSWIPRDNPFILLNKQNEPDWLALLPTSAQRYIRNGYALTEGLDPLAIVPMFPYLGFGYILPDTGLPFEATQVFNLHRLGHIRQLSFLHDPVLRENDRSAGTVMFDHTRYLHSLDTLAIANLVAANIGLDSRYLNTLLTAAISHDALTPAGGDSVKLIDPQAFDEDRHYPELLVGEKWEKYRDHFGIDQNMLIQTIMGKGLLGQILNLADRTSYIARDVHAYTMGSNSSRDFGNTHYSVIRNLAKNDPCCCSLWESARLYKGELVIGNHERLANFLKLRALMFKGLYYNPYSRFFEYLIGKGVVKYLYKTGKITRSDLLHRSDHWLEEQINKTLGTQYILQKFSNLEGARIEEWNDLDQARKRAAEFNEDMSQVVIVDEFHSATSNGTHKFKIRKNNAVLSFAKAFPDEAEEIDMIMTFPNKVRLYFFPADSLEIATNRREFFKKIMELAV